MTALEIVDDVDGRAIPESCADFLNTLRGPTLFRVRGRDRARVRAVVGLLHGNEPSGLTAIHAALRARETPAVDVLMFVGAVEAARATPARRMLPGRRDLNRCFRPPWEGEDGRLAEEVLRALRVPGLEASVDVHNNTGHNPAYVLGAALDGEHLALAALFATKYVETHLKLGTMQEALDDLAPSITVECGRAGDPAADAAAVAGVRRFLQAETIDPVFLTTEHFSVLVDPVRVQLRPGLTLSFAEAQDTASSLTLDPEIDRHNFEVLPAGTRLGWVRADAPFPVAAQDATGADVAHRHFAVQDGALVTRHSFVPIMMTTDPAAAMSDCLFYVVRQRE